MRQREELRAVRGKRSNGLRHGAHSLRSQEMPLRILTDQERSFEIGQMLEQSFVPKRSALRARRQIASVVSGAGITKADRQDCHSCFVVENRAVELQPIAQAIAIY